MSFFSKIFSINSREASPQAESSKAVAVKSPGFDLAGSSRVSVDEYTALKCPAYLRAVSVIAQSVAVLPFRYMMQQNGVYVEKEGDNEHYLLSVQAMELMSNYQWKFQIAFQSVHHGEALVYPRIINDKVSEYVLIDFHYWSHDDVNNTYTITDIKNGVYGTFDESEVLHFVWNSLDGKNGQPLWILCKPALDIYATGDKETQKRFESGGNVKGIVSNNVAAAANGGGVGQYKTDNLSDVAYELEMKFNAGRNINAVGGDAKFTPMSSTSADLQFVDQQKRVVNEIARAAGVPINMLYVESTGTQYNTPEMAVKAFNTQTLEPMLQMIETEFQRKRISRLMCHKRIYKFDRDALYALDLKSKAEYYERMQRIGVWSTNDIRDKENMTPVEGGDTIYLSTNLAEIGSEKLAGSTDNILNKPNNNNNTNTNGKG